MNYKELSKTIDELNYDGIKEKRALTLDINYLKASTSALQNMHDNIPFVMGRVEDYRNDKVRNDSNNIYSDSLLSINKDLIINIG